MKILITVINKQEAATLIKYGFDILDVKNPAEGSLGAPAPRVLKEIWDIIPDGRQRSIAVGDVPNLPGTVALAALGALQFKPDYIKLGLRGARNRQEAAVLVKEAVGTVDLAGGGAMVVAAGFADYCRVGSVAPLDIPAIAHESGASVGMIDTAIKDGKGLLDLMPLKEIEEFVRGCHAKNIKAAVAGSLDETHIEKMAGIGVDIFGVRGAVCLNNDRNADLDRSRIERIVSKIKGSV